MRHTKIFIRDDKTKIKVLVTLTIDWFNPKSVWTFTVSYCPPKKRNFIYLDVTNDYAYRRLDTEKRKEYELQEYYKYVSPQELLEVKLELWQQLKPE